MSMLTKQILILTATLASCCTIYAFCHKFLLETLSKLSPPLVLAIIMLLILSLIISVTYILYLRKKLKEETSPIDFGTIHKEAMERMESVGTGKTKNP